MPAFCFLTAYLHETVRTADLLIVEPKISLVNGAVYQNRKVLLRTVHSQYNIIFKSVWTGSSL